MHFCVIQSFDQLTLPDVARGKPKKLIKQHSSVHHLQWGARTKKGQYYFYRVKACQERSLSATSNMIHYDVISSW